MPLPKQVPAKLSARAVYAQQGTSNDALKKGRGRPRKFLPVSGKQQAKIGQKMKKHKSLVKYKNSADDGLEADLSSEAEETEKKRFPKKGKVPKKTPLKAFDIESDEEESGSDEDENLEDTDEATDPGESNEETADGEVEDEEEISTEDETTLYSFPEPNNQLVENKDKTHVKGNEKTSGNTKKEKGKNKAGNKEKKVPVQKEEVSQDENEKDTKEEVETILKPKKRKNKVKSEDSDTEAQAPSASTMLMNGSSKPPKKQVKIDLANSASREIALKDSIPGFSLAIDEDLSIFDDFPSTSRRDGFCQTQFPQSPRLFPQSPRLFPQSPRLFPQSQRQFQQSQRQFQRNHPLTPSRRTSFQVPILPKIGTIDSLIKSKMVNCGNSAAEFTFQWLLSPTTPQDFFENHFEKNPLVVHRDDPQYYGDLFSGNDVNAMLKEHHLEYGVHIDVVKYVDETRCPVEGDGRAYYSNVWEDYKQGYSIRIRNPQSYHNNLWKTCSLLQEYFSSTVGVNMYLTPPKAQGFPPHYDDIDAFIIQIEGRKLWKVYRPRQESEELARYSSRDFDQDEIGEPILEICLNAGDMLYIPRGFIHQAITFPTHHSLHLTFSTNQLNTWGDLMLVATQKAVEKAILNNVEFRESLPKDYMDHIGRSVSESTSFARFEILSKVKELSKKVVSLINTDEAADLHSVNFISGSLPPIFNKLEKERSLHGNGSYWKNGVVKVKGIIELDTQIQLIKKRNLRLVVENDRAKLFHTLENQRDPQHHGENGPVASFVDLDLEGVAPFMYLQKRFPNFVRVRDLPIEEREDRISYATSLYENGLIMTKDPLPRLNEDTFDWTTIPDISIIKRERP